MKTAAEIDLKTPEEITTLRENGRLLSSILREICARVTPGRTTGSLDRQAEELIRSGGATPSFKGYRGYQASICTSVNEEIVHGIPSGRRLRDGDLLSIDIGLQRDGLHVDMATTLPVGVVDPAARHLLRVAEEGLWRGIGQVRIGNRLSDVSHAIGSYVKGQGLNVVREYVGHGIGRELHEDPPIPNCGAPGYGPWLRAGMVLALEPMVKLDSQATRVLGNDWTVVTATGCPAAHFEHTVALTEDGVDVLTRGGE